MGLSTQRCSKQFRSLLGFLRAKADHGLQRRSIKLREEKFKFLSPIDICSLDYIFADSNFSIVRCGFVLNVENSRHFHNGFTELLYPVLLLLP